MSVSKQTSHLGVGLSSLSWFPGASWDVGVLSQPPSSPSHLNYLGIGGSWPSPAQWPSDLLVHCNHLEERRESFQVLNCCPIE